MEAILGRRLNLELLLQLAGISNRPQENGREYYSVFCMGRNRDTVNRFYYSFIYCYKYNGQHKSHAVNIYEDELKKVSVDKLLEDGYGNKTNFKWSKNV